MSSIPLPALDIRPPQQPENPLEAYARALQVKGMMQRQQMGNVELQQAQQQQKDQQAQTAAMQEWDGKDLNQLPGLVMKHGGSAQTVMGLKASVLKQQQEYATYDETRLKNEAQKNDMLMGHLDALKGVPDEQLGGALTSTLQQAVQQGLVDPQHAQGIAALAQKDPATIRQALALFEKGNTGHKAQIDQAMKERTQEADLAAKAAQLPGQIAESKTREAEAAAMQQYGGMTQAQQESRYRNVLMNLQLKRPVSADDLSFAKAFEASNAKTTTSSDAFGVKTVSTARPSGLAGVGVAGGGGTGGGGSNLSKTGQALVDQIGTGRVVPERMAYLLAREPNLMQAVSAKYPDFDSSKAQAYAATYRDFTSGQTSKYINAGGTALQHLAQLKKINDENPGEVRIHGTAANQAYNNLLNTVSGELIRFYGQPETNESIASMKSTLGGAFGGLLNRNAAIQEQAVAMGVKMDSYEQQWKNAAPSPAYQAPLPGISAEAKRARAELDPNYKVEGAQAGMTRIKASDGSLHDVPTANLGAARKIDPKLTVIQ